MQQENDWGQWPPNDGLSYQMGKCKNGFSCWRCNYCGVFVTEGHIQSTRHKKWVAWRARQPDPWTGVKDGRETLPDTEAPKISQKRPLEPSDFPPGFELLEDHPPPKLRQLETDFIMPSPRSSIWVTQQALAHKVVNKDTSNLEFHPSPEVLDNFMRFHADYVPLKWRKLERAFIMMESKKMDAEDKMFQMVNHISRSEEAGPVVVEKVVTQIVEVPATAEGEPQFKAGQAVHQWWARWMPGAETVPQSIGGKGRPAWYSSSVINPPEWATTVYGGTTLEGWSYRVY